MGLDWTGSPLSTTREQGGLSTFKVVALIFAVYYILSNCLQVIITLQTPAPSMVQYPDDGSAEVSSGVAFLSFLNYCVTGGFFLYTLVLMIRTRSYIRSKYAIPEQYMSGCDDCCLSLFCHCCTITQMARHTADYHTYPAACCTDTGLTETAPEVV
jgi:Cys-rich protein (TIGR01571 family)